MILWEHMTKLGKIIRIVLYILFAVTLGINLIDAYKVEIPSIWQSTSHRIVDGWTLIVDDAVVDSDLSIPTVLDNSDLVGRKTTLSRTLSERPDHGNNLMFRTSQKTVDVYLDGKLLYSYDASLPVRHASVPGYINHFVWLPSDYQGKTLEIVMVGYSERTSGTFYPIFLESRISHVLELIRYDGLALLFGIFILLTAAAVFILSVTLFRKLAVRKSALAFAGIELCAGLWLTGGSMSAQLLIHNQVFLLVFGVFAMYMLPVFLTLFVKHMYKIPESNRLLLVVQVFPVGLMITSLLQYADIATYYTFFTPVAICLLLYLSVLIGYCYKAFRRGNRDIKQFLIAMLFLLVSVLGELVLLLLPFHTLLNALFLHVGILGFGLILLRQVLYHVMLFVEERGKEEYLLSLAHTDGLTEVANRRAFEERLQALKKQSEPYPVGLMIFDVNNLKEHNDVKGHAAGDELLRTLASILERGFDKVGTVYRVGGDEFAMICAPCDCKRYERAKEQLFSAHQDLLDISSPMSIAYGEALWLDKHDFNSLDEVYAVADERMYKQKTEMKQGRVR